ncbi:tetratricopeptide repeat protein [Longimicrobium sp.]|uniref:tetratricopeptide repeat protein n=1 Tax=Longimicrobium sp. TaxID=2029185 RepID=UPI002BF77623|nr:tetratricopeptide repeat protein [Longimicrobium sp.]HSU12719.1 tetratricopeptide repeat protein [Longimicrobium sp.]
MTLEIDRRPGRVEGLSITCHNLGLVHKRRGDLDGAERMFRGSLEAAEQLGVASLIERASAALAVLREPKPSRADQPPGPLAAGTPAPPKRTPALPHSRTPALR